MTQRIVSVGDDFALPEGTKVLDGHLPTRLSVGGLSDTYVGYAAAASGDDLAHLQATVTAAASSGRIVSLKAGEVYNISAPLLIPSNAVIDGNNATIKAMAGNNTYVLSNSDRVNGNSGIAIRNLKVDGNPTGQTAQYPVVSFMRVTHSKFDNMDVSGGKRTQMFPDGTHGEGFMLIYSHYNEINGGYFHHNTYDGIKLRGSNWNKISNVLCEDNGRSGIQISFYSPTGPPYNVGEDVESEGSNHNTIAGATVRHSTGTPHFAAPTTSGLYIHTGYRNTVIGLQVEGTRQGIGVFGGASDNEFIGGLLRIRFAGDVNDRASIDIEGGPGSLNRNSFKGITTRALSGANGKHVNIAPNGALNRFDNCYFSRGAGTGTWIVDVRTGAGDNWFFDCFNDGTWTDNGTATTIREQNVSGYTRTKSRAQWDLTNHPADLAAPASGVRLNAYLDLLRIRFPSGFLVSMGGGGMRLTDGGALPAADAGNRGQIRLVFGGAGVADQFVVCRKTASETYEWAPLS